MKPRTRSQVVEIRARRESFVGGLLDERERLGARKQVDSFLREVGTDQPQSEASDGRGPEVEMRAARARERVEDLGADRERRDEQDLLVYGMGLAESGELLKEPVSLDGRAHVASLSEASAV